MCDGSWRGHVGFWVRSLSCGDSPEKIKVFPGATSVNDSQFHRCSPTEHWDGVDGTRAPPTGGRQDHCWKAPGDDFVDSPVPCALLGVKCSFMTSSNHFIL